MFEITSGFARVLKTFAVRYGLLAVSVTSIAGTHTSAARKSLRTIAKSFLMHAHKATGYSGLFYSSG